MKPAHRRLLNRLPLALALLSLGGCALFGPGWEQRKINALQSADSSERLDALKDVKDCATPAMRPILEKLLGTDVEPTARALAAEAIGGLGMKDSEETLRLAARRDTSWLVRERALGALVRILGAGAAADLDFAVTNDPYPTIRLKAIEMAVTTLDPKARGALLLKGLKDPSKAVQLTAHKYLKELLGLDIPPDHYAEWSQRLGTQ